MTITEYLNRPGSLSRAEICAGLSISAGRLSQLRDSREWPPELALKLEEITRGEVSANDICPVIAKARTA